MSERPISFQRRTPPPLQYVMRSRSASVRAACACLMVASSAWYSADVVAAGADAGLDREVPGLGEVVLHRPLEPREVHPIGDERHVLAPDVAAALRVVPDE